MKEVQTFQTNVGIFECVVTGFHGHYTIGLVKDTMASEWELAFWPIETGPSEFELGAAPPEELVSNIIQA